MCQIFAALVCFFLLTPNTLAQADAPLSLRPDWQPGQSATYEFWTLVEQRFNVKLGPNTQDGTATQKYDGEVTWTVKTVKPDGSITAIMTLDWITMTAESEGNKTTADSRKKPSDPAAAPLHDFLSSISTLPLTVDMKPDGSVTKIAGIKAMKAKSKSPDALPEELDFIESASDLASIAFAPASAEVGKKFDAEFRWPHEMGHMDYDWDYTLESVSEISGVPIATIAGKAKMKLDVDESQIPADGPKVNTKLSTGSAAIQILFDLSRHEVVARTATEREIIDVTVNLPDGRRFQRRLDQTTTSQLLRISEE